MSGEQIWIEIINAVYPDLSILLDQEEWLNGKYEKPYVYIEIDSVTETSDRIGANKVTKDVGLVFEFEIGQPIDTELLMKYLRKERFSVVSHDRQSMIDIGEPKIKEKKNRVEIIFRYTYLVSVPRKCASKGVNV